MPHVEILASLFSMEMKTLWVAKFTLEGAHLFEQVDEFDRASTRERQTIDGRNDLGTMHASAGPGGLR
jgi:hypothetical protein